MFEHPAVAESAEVAKPDPVCGEMVKAYIVLAGGQIGSDDLRRKIQAFVEQHSAPYKYPRQIEFTESLPKTISGKNRRVELRQTAA